MPCFFYGRGGCNRYDHVMTYLPYNVYMGRGAIMNLQGNNGVFCICFCTIIALIYSKGTEQLYFHFHVPSLSSHSISDLGKGCINAKQVQTMKAHCILPPFA